MFHRGYICTCWVADYQIPIEGWWSRTQEEPIQTFCIIFSRPCIRFVTPISHKCREEDDSIQILIVTSLCQWSEGESFIMLRLPQQNTLTGQENIWNWGKYYNLQFWLSIISRSNEDKDKLLFLASVHGFHKTAVIVFEVRGAVHGFNKGHKVLEETLS